MTNAQVINNATGDDNLFFPTSKADKMTVSASPYSFMLGFDYNQQHVLFINPVVK